MTAAVLDDLDWPADARDAIVKAAEKMSRFTVDDIRDAGLREPPNPNMWGAAFRSAAEDKIIRGTGTWARSRRRQRRNSVHAIWTGWERR